MDKFAFGSYTAWESKFSGEHFVNESLFEQEGPLRRVSEFFVRYENMVNVIAPILRHADAPDTAPSLRISVSMARKIKEDMRK